MREQDWPDEARRAVANALDGSEIRGGMTHHRPLPLTERHINDIDAILAALAPHVTPTAPLREQIEEWKLVACTTNIDSQETGMALNTCADDLKKLIDRA